MSKRTTFTTITPLPAGISRQMAVDFLHNHAEMIDLNPLVIERHPISPPAHAGADEQTCTWYSITDKISYLPGTDLVRGDVTYTCAFHDLPAGLQTHCYAGLGLEIRDMWSVGGSEPGEAPEVQELGLKAPASGLYIREDVDFKCNLLMSAFVKKTLKKAHGTLVAAMGRKAQSNHADHHDQYGNSGVSSTSAPASASYSGGGGRGSSPSGSNSDEKPFVSSGGNQGQPGQGPYARPYQPPRLPEPQHGGSGSVGAYEQGGHARHGSSGSAYQTRREEPRTQQQPVVSEMEGDSSYGQGYGHAYSQGQNHNQRQN